MLFKMKGKGLLANRLRHRENNCDMRVNQIDLRIIFSSQLIDADRVDSRIMYESVEHACAFLLRLRTPEHCADIAKAHHLLTESECSVISHLLSSAKKRAKGDSREHTAHADALHPDLRKLSEAQANAGESHQDVHRAI